jgi:Ulp1 family protease
MIMPINDDGMHWVAAVMDMKAKRVEYYDSMGGTEEKANKAYNVSTSSSKPELGLC